MKAIAQVPIRFGRYNVNWLNHFITVLFIVATLLIAPGRNVFGEVGAGLDVATVQEFDILDRDRSGSLSEREFSFSEVVERLYLAGKHAAVAGVFESIDSNQNDGIELMEMAQSQLNRNARILDRNMSQSFINADTDQDGIISVAEYSKRENANLDLFGKIDLNENGKIGPFEWVHEFKKSRMDKANAREFALLDQDDDGAISSKEFTTGDPPDFLQEAFEAIDLNGNREIGVSEYAKAVSLPRELIGVAPDVVELFEDIDRNRDQSISLREFERNMAAQRLKPGPARWKGDVAENLFEKIDSNDDREISLNELARSRYRGIKKGGGKGKGKGRK